MHLNGGWFCDAVNYLNSKDYTGVYTIEINHNKDMLPAILKSLDNLKKNIG